MIFTGELFFVSRAPLDLYALGCIIFPYHAYTQGVSLLPRLSSPVCFH